jgi:hypothetical protein
MSVPNTIILFQVATEVSRYSGGSQRIFSSPSTTQSSNTNKPPSPLLSGEEATEQTAPESLSSVCSAAPVAASQSRTVLSHDSDTTRRPSGEKATEQTPSEWPSSVCRAALQFACTFGFLWIQAGIHFSNRLRTILFSGAKTRAEQYSWRGACSITDRLYKANRFASWINARRLGLLSALV